MCQELISQSLETSLLVPRHSSSPVAAIIVLSLPLVPLAPRLPFGNLKQLSPSGFSSSTSA